MKRKAAISHHDALVRELRDDSAFAAEYFKAALEDVDEPKVLLIALRQIAEARGGIAKVAKAAGIEREPLPRFVSSRKPAVINAGGRHPCDRLKAHRGAGICFKAQ